MLQVVGDVAVLPQERKEFQQELTEVLTDAKPPCGGEERAERKREECKDGNRGVAQYLYLKWAWLKQI